MSAGLVPKDLPQVEVLVGDEVVEERLQMEGVAIADQAADIARLCPAVTHL
jgi:hypothetical protein